MPKIKRYAGRLSHPVKWRATENYFIIGVNVDTCVVFAVRVVGYRCMLTVWMESAGVERARCSVPVPSWSIPEAIMVLLVYRQAALIRQRRGVAVRT
jgi:hypothetical protein